MARRSSRVRQRFAKRLALSCERVKDAEQARKEKQAEKRLLRYIPSKEYHTLTWDHISRLSPDRVRAKAYSAPGMYNGKITIRGPFSAAIVNGRFVSSTVKGAKRSKSGPPKFIGVASQWDRRERAIGLLGVLILLEACYSGDGLDRRDWLLETGPKVLSHFAPLFNITVAGECSRSVRARNQGTGKPKRGLKPKPWYHSKDKPEPSYRLIDRVANGKVFQETGAFGGKILRDRNR